MIRRFIINKKMAKINENMDKIHFIPVFPPNSNVCDEIKGISHGTPFIGNIAAEKVIMGKLD